MSYLCGGPYPPMDEQAKRLHDERGMPKMPLEQYLAWATITNRMLAGIIISHWINKNGQGKSTT